MTRYHLSRLDIEGFRGINNEGDPLSIKFKPECVNSLYAQNGIGKTSIHEAICYAIFGGLPKLDALQRREQPETYKSDVVELANELDVEIDIRTLPGWYL